MNPHSAFKRTFIFLGGSLLLAGCSSWSAGPPLHGQPIGETWTVPEVQGAAPQGGGNFAHAVAHDDSDYATGLTTLAPQPDYVDADYFARKGLAASRGEVVAPEQNDNWAIPLEQPLGLRTQMAQGRARLVADLDAGGRDRFPVVAARAQVRYDCWLDRTQADWKTGADGVCHREFLAALDELERDMHGAAVIPAAVAVAGPARRYNVYFDFDKSSLTPEGHQIINQAAAAVGTDKTARVELMGKADLSGTDPYNMALSERRADTVRSALAADGIQASQVDTHWDGDREPPVPTAAGVREPRNRVVEVTFN
jgi:OOP family OmpA-OmpF porin